MDTSQDTTPGAVNPAAATSAIERMRLQAAQNPTAAHRSFDTYPWPKDPVFQSQLATALLNQNDLSPAEIALQCRLSRYEERVGIKLDAARYKEYRSSEARPRVDIVPPVILEQEALFEPDVSKRRYAAIYHEDYASQPPEDTIDPNVPSWQRSAPKAALYVNKNSLNATGGSEKEPYPKKFEEIIAFLQTGKEIPGIVKIPDTVVDDPSISTTSGRSAPLKPWEKKGTTEGL